MYGPDAGSHLFVSDSGEQAVLVTKEVELHLWDLKDGLHSEWWKLPVPDDIRRLLSTSTCIAIDVNFYVHQVWLPKHSIVHESKCIPTTPRTTHFAKKNELP